MLTFRELKELLDEAPEMDRVPSMRELMRTGTVFMERPVVNGVVTVFTNGLALFAYCEAKRPSLRSKTAAFRF